MRILKRKRSNRCYTDLGSLLISLSQALFTGAKVLGIDLFNGTFDVLDRRPSQSWVLFERAHALADAAPGGRRECFEIRGDIVLS